MNFTERNIMCIKNRYPDIAHILQANLLAKKNTTATENSSRYPHYRWKHARNGAVSLQCRNQNGEWVWIYSSIDPQREAARIVQQMDDVTNPSHAEPLSLTAKQVPTLIITTPLGNGYLAEKLLERFETADIIVIISDIELCACALEARDFCHLIQNPRFSLYTLPFAQEAPMLISTLYLPALHGDAMLLWNKPLITHSPAQQEMQTALQTAIQNTKSNIAIYRQMGRMWMRNTLKNSIIINNKIKRQTKQKTPGTRYNHDTATDTFKRKIVLIVAAGPSLDQQLSHLQKMHAEQNKNLCAIISTDSAVPVLRQNNITADARVIIDCQLASYLHFYPQTEHAPPLYADISAHPLIFRMHPRLTPTESPHPLSLLLSAAIPLHPLMSRAEHVTQSAFALAITKYHPEQIIIYGADYGYQIGKAYARGTYIPSYQLNNSNCFNPLELQSLLFSWKHNEQPGTSKTSTQIVPHFFHFYRNQLLHFATTQGYTLITDSKQFGMKFQIKNRDSAIHKSMIPAENSHSTLNTSYTSWKDTLTSYHARIRTIPPPIPPYHTYLQQLSKEEKVVLLSLLPLQVHVAQRAWRMNRANAFEAARDEASKLVAHCLRLLE